MVARGLALVDQHLALTHQDLPADNKHVKCYFSSLAKMTNTWRANAVALSAEWSAQNGPELAAKGRKLPAHCLVGRFGSVDTTEKYYMDLGQQRTTKCLEVTLQHRLNNRATTKKRKLEPNVQAGVDARVGPADSDAVEMVDPLGEATAIV